MPYEVMLNIRDPLGTHVVHLFTLEVKSPINPSFLGHLRRGVPPNPALQSDPRLSALHKIAGILEGRFDL
jgi:hypothetical protein